MVRKEADVDPQTRKRRRIEMIGIILEKDMGIVKILPRGTSQVTCCRTKNQNQEAHTTMMMMFRCLLTVASLVCVTQAFTVQVVVPTTTTTTRAGPLFAGRGQNEGAAIAKPKVQIGQKTAVVTKTVEKVEIKRKIQIDDPVSRRGDDDFQEAPLFKVLLVGDDSYDPEHIVTRSCAIIDDMDEDRAMHVLEASIESGKAVFGKYPLETAEMYKEQFIRSDPIIYADIEEENKI